MYGIWIPAASILKRRNYEWFVRLSSEQIFQSKFILAKYFVLALAPYNNNKSVVESLALAGEDDLQSDPKDWMTFWQVPSSTTLPVYGPMPQNLGNNVPQYKL